LAKVALEGVSKSYDDSPVVKDIHLAVAHNEFVALVGPSGCGKSTILRMIAGLEEISTGTVRIGDVVVNELPPRDRNVAMVFQNYALFPHMTVRDNLSFGLKLAKRPAAEIAARVQDVAAVLGLAQKLDRRPAQLSGGERQRVAMGRAMVRQPDVFLFDEPLSNLDAKLRTTMRTEIKRLHRRVATTMIYVTHDQVEAMTLADRIVILRDGRVEQIGTPNEVFAHPANSFVAGFIGSPPMNFIEATVGTDRSLDLGNGVRVPVPHDLFQPLQPGRRVTMGMRAESLTPRGYGQAPGRLWDFAARVSFTEPLGSETLLIVELANREVVAKVSGACPIAAGEEVPLQMNLEGMHLFDIDSGRSLAG